MKFGNHTLRKVELDELAKPCWSFGHMNFDPVSFARSGMHAQEQEQGECSSCKNCFKEVTIYHNYYPMGAA